jgi:hypothetical protein
MPGLNVGYRISLALRAASLASLHAAVSVTANPRLMILSWITSQYHWQPSPLGMIRNSTFL